MNRMKIIYRVVGIVIVVILLYNSVYCMSLSEKTRQLQSQSFDPAAAIESFRKEGAEQLSDKAIDLEYFDELVIENPHQLAEKYGKTLGIGAPYSILVKGFSVIQGTGDEVVYIGLDTSINYSIRTGSVFSNTIREASGYFDLDDFETTMEFNLLTIEINHHIIDQVISPVVSQMVPGATVEFLGAADINLRKLPVTSVDIIPIHLRIIQP